METDTLDKLYQRMQNLQGCNSIAKKYLTLEIVSKYKDVKTKSGGTLALCVKSNAYDAGVLLPRCTDADCYSTFKDYFDPVIRDYHRINSESISHPSADFGDFRNLPFSNPDASKKYVLSTRMEVRRAVQGFAFAPLITKENRVKLEGTISKALGGLTGEHKGFYSQLSGMKEPVLKQLVDGNFHFGNQEKNLAESADRRDWPNGRGVFHNQAKTFLVLVNDDDHIRITSTGKGGNFAEVYKRLVNGIREIEKKVKCDRSKRLGYLTSCPSNLGTAMRVSVHMRIPYTSHLTNFEDICEKLFLQVRQIDGDVFEIFNQSLLGLTEIQAVSDTFSGVKELIRYEVGLEQSNSKESLKSGVMLVEPLEMLAEMMWNNEECKSFTKKHLTPEIVKKYKDKKTRFGSTLSHCIRMGAYHSLSNCPRVGDPDCYEDFIDYIEAIIKDYHKVTDGEVKQPPTNFGDLKKLPFDDLDPSGKYILSTRVRVGRSVEGYSYPPIITKEERLKLQSTISDALNKLKGQHAGKYYPLEGMSDKVHQQLIDDHFLFQGDDPLLRDAGACRDWPSGRGIFHNEAKTFLVWVCEEDHIRIISMQKGGNLREVFTRLAEGVKELETKIKFATHPKYGYLTFCPSNLGTTMRASVLIKVPKLSADISSFRQLCAKHKLQIRGLYGYNSESSDGIFDLSNVRRLGLTELDAAAEMAAGVREIIKLESSM